MGCHSLLMGIFPTQGLNLGLLHCGETLNNLGHQGRPASAVEQCESAACIHTSPFKPPPAPPLQAVVQRQAELLSQSSFPPAASHAVVASVRLRSQFAPPSPSSSVLTGLFSTSASLFLPCKQVHLYCFFFFFFNV